MKTIKTKCEVCGKVFEQDEDSIFLSKFCGSSDCYYESICIEQMEYLKKVLSDVVGQKLIGFDLSSDGGKAIMKFEKKTVIIGAGGNLWDEAFPVYSDEADKFMPWKPKVV